MKLCGLVRKLRSSQPTLQPMNVKIKLHYNPFVDINVKMDYYEWMQYLHDEIEKDKYYIDIHDNFTYIEEFEMFNLKLKL